MVDGETGTPSPLDLLLIIVDENDVFTTILQPWRGRVHTRAQVYLVLCLRLVIAITNYERGDNPGSSIITG